MFKIHFDFETYSKCDIKKAGGWRYAEDESTEILCFAFKINDSKTRVWYPGRPKPLDLILILQSGNYVYKAHNAEFETAVWLRILHEKEGWPAPIFKNIQCTAAKAAALALPRKLEEVGRALELPIQKDNVGHRIMMKLSKPRKPTKKDKTVRFTPENAFMDFIQLYAYCVRDVDTEEAIDNNLRDLSKKELTVYHLDQKINRRGVYLDREAIETALSFIKKYSDTLNEKLLFLTGGTVETANQRDKILQFLEVFSVQLPDLTAARVEKTLKKKDLPEEARTILEIRQALSKSSTKKLETMLKMICSDNRVRGTLLYHGASTGRWSGKGIQPQNFPRGSLKGDQIKRVFELLKEKDYKTFVEEFPDVLDAISSCLRGMIRSAPGKKLIAADFSAIEARVLFWLANCVKGVKLYEAGEDTYCYMAGDIYGYPVNKKNHPDERQLGKQAILGCGYGMGKDKFRDTCLGYNMDVSKEMSEKAVGTYRTTFWEVPQFWRDLETAAVQAVRNPGQVFSVRKISYKRQGRFLFCRLPSGRLIAYYKPHFRWAKTSWGEDKLALHYWGVNSQTRKFEPISTYGGKLTENVVQAVARCLMSDAMIRAEDRGYNIIMSVHDELVSEVDKDFGSVKEFEQIMSELPAWAEGCPVDAEGWEGIRFKK